MGRKKVRPANILAGLLFGLVVLSAQVSLSAEGAGAGIHRAWAVQTSVARGHVEGYIEGQQALPVQRPVAQNESLVPGRKSVEDRTLCVRRLHFDLDDGADALRLSPRVAVGETFDGFGVRWTAGKIQVALTEDGVGARWSF